MISYRLVCCIILSICSISLGDALRVPQDYASIQAGIDAARNRDTVLVDQGEYNENIDFSGKNIVVASYYIRDQNIRIIERTIIDASNRGHAVTFTNQETRSAQLIGFTVQNGRSIRGGGLYCVEASPTLSHLVVQNNFAAEDGAGIYCYDNAGVLIEHSNFSQNIAEDQGGGLFIKNHSNAIVRNCVVRNNSGSSGGGIYLNEDCNCLFENVEVYENQADMIGGGIALIVRCNSRFNHVAVCRNRSGNLFGGGLHIGASEVELINMTIADNSTDGRGGGIHFSGAGDIQMKNSIIWNNQPNEIYSRDMTEPPHTISIEYTDINEGREGVVVAGDAQLTWGEGNIDSDPLFVEPIAVNYRLNENSPCINAGDPDSPRDPDGSRADMGTFPYDPRSAPGLTDKSLISKGFALIAAYPNPFNSQTRISFRIGASDRFSMDVIDMQGNRLPLIDGKLLDAGKHDMAVDGTDWANGTYFIRLSNGMEVETTPIVLVK